MAESRSKDVIQKKIQEKFGSRTAVIGGKGAIRRKFKASSKSSTQDDKRLHTQLKKLNVNVIPAIDEVNLFKDDGTVVHFSKPKVEAEITSNTYVISGHCETKKIEELIPAILPQLGAEHIESLKKLADTFNALKQQPDEEIPQLVEENFEQFANRDENKDTTSTTATAAATTTTTDTAGGPTTGATTTETTSTTATTETAKPTDVTTANTTATATETATEKPTETATEITTPANTTTTTETATNGSTASTQEQSTASTNTQQ